MDQKPRTYSKYELLFTPHLIPNLKGLRGEEWQQLVDKLEKVDEIHPDTLAFSWMMIKLGGCSTCDMDSYRAQRGCAPCAQQSISSFKGTDEQLVNKFEQTKLELKLELDNLITRQQRQAT